MHINSTTTCGHHYGNGAYPYKGRRFLSFEEENDEGANDFFFVYAHKKSSICASLALI
jgi:hypothetical protein